MRWNQVLVVSLFFGACNDGAERILPTHETQTVSVTFDARFRNQPVRCGETFQKVGARSHTARLGDFRFYASDVKLVNLDGKEVPLSLTPDGLFQDENVALIDFEDDHFECEGHTPGIHNQITGTVPLGDYNGLVFTVGVPVTVNHLDPATELAPLNAKGMGWGWELGHKFFKLELEVANADGDFTLHVGSTGCKVPDGKSRADTTCERPNRATIRLSDIDFESERVTFELADFLQRTDIVASNCQSFPDSKPACTPLFERLGVDFATGACVADCSKQSAFTVE